MATEKDDLEAFIAECAIEDPDFPAMVEAALNRRRAVRAQGEDPKEIDLADETKGDVS